MIGVVIQRNDAITYFTCSSISRHWELFFKNRSRELFPPIAASMFVKLNSVIEIFQDEDFMARNTVKKWTPDVFVDFRRPCWCTKTVHQNGVSILYKGAWNVSENNPETLRDNDLRLGWIVYKLVFYNISLSWLLPLDGFQFIYFFCCVTA